MRIFILAEMLKTIAAIDSDAILEPLGDMFLLYGEDLEIEVMQQLHWELLQKLGWEYHRNENGTGYWAIEGKELYS